MSVPETLRLCESISSFWFGTFSINSSLSPSRGDAEEGSLRLPDNSKEFP